jgi:hypothetical protein
MTSTYAPGDLVYARGREWVALPSPDDEILYLRPLSGAEADVQVIHPTLEREPVRPARFALPSRDETATQDGAHLLSEALRLSLRRGAGPFRSAARLAFEPRAYQLVPLLMALRLAVVRLLIADDVGIGKTIEAGLILRELIDRGEADRFAILCPPHLVEQWTGELQSKFNLDAVAVTAASASRLERGLADVAGGMLARALWHPPGRVFAIFEHSPRLTDHIERAFTGISVTAGPHTVPVEGCFMPKSIANPFLEMADCIANAVTKNVKYQRAQASRIVCTHAFQALFRDAEHPLASYCEVTAAR